MKLIPALLLGGLLLAQAHAACSATTRGAAAVKKAALNNDASSLVALLDSDALFERVQAGVQMDEASRRDIRKGFVGNGLNTFKSLLNSISGANKQLVEQPTAPSVAILRLESKTPGHGVGYLEFELDKAGCIVDWVELSTSARASSKMRQLLASMIQDSSVLASMFGITQLDKAQFEKVTQLQVALRSNDPQKIVSALEAMPTTVRNSYDFTMMRIGYLGQIDVKGPAYRAALDELARNYGSDPRAQGMLIDHYYFTKQYDKALTALGNLQARVGVDTENEFLRASLLAAAGRGEEAVAAMRKVIALNPDRRISYGMMMAIAVAAQRYQDALDAMNQAEVRFGLTFPHKALQSDPNYAGLLASPEYKAWRKKHPG
jgi:hypothetical protein